MNKTIAAIIPPEPHNCWFNFCFILLENKLTYSIVAITSVFLPIHIMQVHRKNLFVNLVQTIMKGHEVAIDEAPIFDHKPFDRFGGSIHL